MNCTWSDGYSDSVQLHLNGGCCVGWRPDIECKFQVKLLPAACTSHQSHICAHGHIMNGKITYKIPKNCMAAKVSIDTEAAVFDTKKNVASSDINHPY